MKGTERVMCVVMLGVCFAAVEASAQRREVSVRYLRAALDSIPNRGSVVFTAEFSARHGLKQANESYLRNKGYSRFVVRDPKTGLTFDSIYCEQNSSVFNTLLGVEGRRIFRFEGHKGPGERREDAIFVNSVQPVRDAVRPGEDDEDDEDEDKTYRVTVIDHTTSNRTVMVNIELGKKFNIMGSTLLIEEEEKDTDAITVME